MWLVGGGAGERDRDVGVVNCKQRGAWAEEGEEVG